MKNIRYSQKGYKIDYSTNTLIMNYKFAKSAQDFGSPEYVLLKSLKTDFPMMKTITKAGRKIDTTRLTKRLTYVNIEEHIKAYCNSEDLLENFELAKQLSKPLASPYKYVRDWFYTQFPDYGDSVKSLYNTAKNIALVGMPDINNYERKESCQA